MSGIVGEFARVSDAFERPTLRLLEYKWAPLALAVLRSAFPRDRRSVPAEQLHVQVTTFVDELAASGLPVPPETGRELCLSWMRGKWLTRAATPSGEEYSLTSHALEALEIVASMSRERSLLSESRLATIVAAARRAALEASPDTDRRLGIIDAQIAELTEQRARIAAGLDAASNDDRVIDSIASLQDLLSQMPSDFKRVEEAMGAMHRGLLERFRNGGSNVGEVVSEYLDAAAALLQDTPEGRAFAGAQDLLRDDAMLADLRLNLGTVLAHPAAAALSAAETRELESTVSTIRDGRDNVLAVRHRLSGTLRDHIISRDAAADRELDSVLREVEQELYTWMESARARDRVPVRLLPEQLDVSALKTRFWDPANAVPPPPLEDTSHEAPPPVSLAEYRKMGGPTMDALRELLESTTAGSLGEAFNSLPPELRRPVEIVGLLQAADESGQYNPEQVLESYAAVRADGTLVAFAVPRIPLAPEMDSAPEMDLTPEMERS